jgi:hypothetical protein
MLINDGRAKDRTQVLSADSAKLMQQPTAKLPLIPQLGSQMGLGWMLDEWDGERVLGHGGNTIGQASFLKVLPDRPFAITLLTNSTTGGALWRDLSRFLFTDIAGVHPPENPKLPAVAPKVDLKRYEGTYAKLGLEAELKAEKTGLFATLTQSGALASGPPQNATLMPVDKEIFLVNMMGEDVVAHFLDFDKDGRPRYVHIGARVSRRKAEASTKKKKAPARKKSARKR